MDLDAGYWQVLLEKASRDKTALFVPGGKKHFLRIPMGILCAHAFFVCMTNQFRKEWHEVYKKDPRATMERLVEIIKKLKEKVATIMSDKSITDME